jgi:DNA-binding PadR family transcriptional regulator
MKRDDDVLGELGRFSEPAMLIMTSLADGPKHGYAMTQDIEQLFGQRLGPGTLYGGITRLEARGWIEPLPSKDRRRPYQLTSAGRGVLNHHLATMKKLTRIALTRLANA